MYLEVVGDVLFPH